VIRALPFTWTKLSAYETCPLRHLKVDIQKAYKEAESDQLAWGSKVHSAFEAALKAKNGRLPDEMEPWQKHIDNLRSTPGEILVEQKYALLKTLEACEYFAPAAYYRGKADVVKLTPNAKGALAIDWKTGRRKIGPENKQLALMALCVFAYHKTVERVLSRFVWLETGEQDDTLWTRQSVTTEFVENLLPRVGNLLEAARTEKYIAKPSGLCKSYCPVQSCEFWGKGSR
jgi:hypothetical protein